MNYYKSKIIVKNNTTVRAGLIPASSDDKVLSFLYDDKEELIGVVSKDFPAFEKMNKECELKPLTFEEALPELEKFHIYKDILAIHAKLLILKTKTYADQIKTNLLTDFGLISVKLEPPPGDLK